tara:strand:- start:324 stop:476 length:153 start_codon:yes stop_codon:yes gene_type:complete
MVVEDEVSDEFQINITEEVAFVHPVTFIDDERLGTEESILSSWEVQMFAL